MFLFSLRDCVVFVVGFLIILYRFSVFFHVGVKDELLQDLFSFFSSAERGAIVFMGSELHGDDAIGVEIGLALGGDRKVGHILSIISYTSPINVLGKVVNHSPSHVLFVDGVVSGLEPGTILLLRPEQVVNHRGSSTHFHQLSELVSLLETSLGKKLETLILGVQIKNKDVLSSMSPEVRSSKRILVDVFSSLYSIFSTRPLYSAEEE